MDLETFKKIIGNSLNKKGFSKKGSFYYYSGKDLIIVIGFQKSNFSNSYYVNLGYTINELNPDLSNPRDVDGDVRVRFTIDTEGKKSDLFELDVLTNLQLVSEIDKNINQYLVESVDELKCLLQAQPTMLYQTKLTAKKLMKFE